MNTKTVIFVLLSKARKKKYRTFPRKSKAQKGPTDFVSS